MGQVAQEGNGTLMEYCVNGVKKLKMGPEDFCNCEVWFGLADQIEFSRVSRKKFLGT